MKLEDYKHECLNIASQYAGILRNAIVSGWNPAQLRAVTDSRISDLEELNERALEDEDLDRYDLTCAREHLFNLTMALDKATDGIIEFLEATDELF